jgi:hypothetical protein
MFALVSTVQATNVLGHRAGSNAVVTFNRYNLTATIDSAFTFNDYYSIEPSEISTTVFLNDPAYSKEVNVHDAAYGDTGWYGNWWCYTWGSGNLCLIGLVQINLSYGPYSLSDAKSLVCEEVGHSVGLAHNYGSTGLTSCMSQAWDQTKLNFHDQTTINNIY